MALRKLRARRRTEPGSARLSLPGAGTQHGEALPGHFLSPHGTVAGLTGLYTGKSDQVTRTREQAAVPDRRLPARHPPAAPLLRPRRSGRHFSPPSDLMARQTRF